MKICTKCRIEKGEPEFVKRSSARDGLTTVCRLCWSTYHRVRYHTNIEASRKKGRESARKQREKDPEKVRNRQRDYRRLNPDKAQNVWLKTEYGITLAYKRGLLKAQGGGCAVCGKKVKLDVDHNHKTGKVRGLLCRPCNMSLGLLKESSETIIALLRYLKKHS